MSDSIMNDIKNGKGLEPLQSQLQSLPKQTNETAEQKDSDGIIHMIFTKNAEKAKKEE